MATLTAAAYFVLDHIDVIAALTPCLPFAAHRAGTGPKPVNFGAAHEHVRVAARTAVDRGLLECIDRTDRAIEMGWICRVQLTAKGLACVTAYHTEVIDE